MIENLISKDTKALDYFGKAYIRTPRVITERQCSPTERERNIANIHYLLFCFCNFAETYEEVNGHLELCRKGEWITTYDELAGKANISRATARSCVAALVKDSLVETRRVADRTCFRVCGYALFTEGQEPKPAARNSYARASSIERLEEEEQKRFGNKKPRIDLLNT